MKKVYMTLHTKFKVIIVAKTNTKIFKDLKVGDVIDISIPLDIEKDQEKGQRMYLYINGEHTYISTLNKMIQIGFEFEEVSDN